MASICHDLMTEPVQIQELAAFLDRLEHYPAEPPKSEASERMNELKKLVESGQNATVMQKLINDSDMIFNKGSETEIAHFFALYGSLLMKLKGDTLTQGLNTVLEKVRANLEDKKQLRLQILGDLFNLDPDHERRFNVLLAVFKYASESGQPEALHSQLESLDSWVEGLQLNLQQKRELYKAAIKVFDSPSDAFEILIRLLETYEAEGEDLTAVQPFVHEQVLNTIKTSEVLRTDTLLQLRAVKDLKGKDPAYELLEIFTCHGCKEYKQFVASNPSFLKSEGLDDEACLTKIRLLTLSGLCAEKTQITFAEVAQTLNIDESEVEMWVVDVVTQGLIDVKINQPKQIITLRHTELQVFNEKQWRGLKTRVETVKANVQQLLKVVESQNVKANTQ